MSEQSGGSDEVNNDGEGIVIPFDLYRKKDEDTKTELVSVAWPRMWRRDVIEIIQRRATIEGKAEVRIVNIAVLLYDLIMQIKEEGGEVLAYARVEHLIMALDKNSMDSQNWEPEVRESKITKLGGVIGRILGKKP